MKTKTLTAAQIEGLARLLAARIGDEHADLSFTLILAAATADQVEARLTLVVDYGNTELAAGTAPAVMEEPGPVTAPVSCKHQAIRDQALSGALPQVQDFSKPSRLRGDAAPRRQKLHQVSLPSIG